jgi:methionine-rich copper-binding protein CopC
MKIFNMRATLHIGMITLLLFTGISAFAQQKVKRKTPEERAAIITSRMKISLNLSDDQYAKVKAVNLNFATKFDEIRMAEDKKDLMGKMKNLDSERMKSLKAVLTPDQYTKYETEKNAAKERMKKSMEERVKQKS